MYIYICICIYIYNIIHIIYNIIYLYLAIPVLRNLGSRSIISHRVVSWYEIFSWTQGFFNDNVQKLRKI